MSRRIIVSILVVLIVGIIGGTAVLVAQRLKPKTTPTPTPQGGLKPADSGTQKKAENTGTNVNLPAATRLPNKQLALPLTDQQVTGYFQEDLDLSGGTTNYSEKYQQQYKPEQRTATTLAEFTKAQPIITRLPAPDLNSIKKAPDDSLAALASYLGVAENIYVITSRDTFNTNMKDFLDTKDVSNIRDLALSVRLYQEDLVAAPVPTRAMPVHKLLLSYTRLLAATYDQMALWDQDQLKSILAMRQLQEINKLYYPLISQELFRLQSSPIAAQ